MAFRGTASVAMWANVNTQGTHSLRDSYNVSGIADVGGNTVRITIDDDMDNSNYCVVNIIPSSKFVTITLFK